MNQEDIDDLIEWTMEELRLPSNNNSKNNNNKKQRGVDRFIKKMELIKQDR